MRSGTCKFGGSELTMDKQQLHSMSNALNEIQKLAPFKDPEQRLKYAEKVLYNVMMTHKTGLKHSSETTRDLMEISAISVANSVRRAKAKAAETIQDTNPSYVSAPVNPNAKNISIPDPSTYPTYEACARDMVSSYGLSQNDSVTYCKSITDPNLKASALAIKKKYSAQDDGSEQAYQDCLDSGKSDSECQDERNQLYPQANSWYTTTKSGQQQRRKQASTEIPAYVTLSGDDQIISNYKRMVAANSPIKSASEQAYLREISTGGMEYALRRRPEAIAKLKQRGRESNLKQASSKIPGWARACAAEYIRE
jgi:hypothetical protein